MPFTIEDFNRLGPKARGYMAYMMPNMPQNCPYEKGSKQEKQFNDGQMQAMIEVQDNP